MPETQKFDSGEQIRVNVRCGLNAKEIRKEERDGREVIVVPSYTMPDDVVMNGIMYPAAEIERSYKSLEGTPAPLGHPTVNKMFVSARHPLGLNIGYFGAFNANVERQDGRVYVEKVIDVERANESRMGKRVLAAIEKGDPIHTSTGILLNVRECTTSDLADWEGYDMKFDHDAILLDEEGAATPEQGVGMMVNKNKLKVINSDLAAQSDERIDWLGTELLAELDRKEAVSRWEQIKGAIMEAIGLGRAATSDMRKEAVQMDEVKKEDLDKVSEQVASLTETINSLAETVNGIGETTKAHAGLFEAVNSDRKAERDAVVNQVVEAELLDREIAEATPLPALQKLLANARKAKEVKPAPGLAGAFSGASGEAYSLATDWEN